MRIFLCLLLITVFCGADIQAHSTDDQTKHITWTPLAVEAYNQVMQLRLNDATQSIATMRSKDPHNYVFVLIENYIDFFRLFIGENIVDFNRLKKNKDTRLSLLAQTNPNSPYFLYCRAEINLQWALARLKFEEYARAFFEVKSAYSDLTTNVKKYPDFIANKKSLGVLHAAIGTIPDEYKWGVSWLGGMKGSIDQGLSELEEVIRYGRNHDFIFQEEAIVMYAFTQLHLNNNPQRAWNIISGSKLNPSFSPLACFALSNLAMRTGRNETAIKYLTNRPKGNQYYPFLFLDYMLGVAKLHRLDSDADVYLKSYATRFKGKNYLKETYQKLAWYELVNGNHKGYHDHMARVLTVGNNQLDEDKTALREAKSKETPHALLLQARLLFDGGYLSRAYKLLNAVNVDYFSSENHRLEYNYRKARVAHALKNYVEAIELYTATIQQGSGMSSYYACSAALNLGQLYENQRNKVRARAYYNLCLSMKPTEYRSGLHQKAKAGLNRL